MALSCLFLQLLSFPTLPQTRAAASSHSQNKDGALEQAVHDYILAHPEVIIESLQRAKERVEERQLAIVKSKIMAFKEDLIADQNAPVLSNPKGDVTLVEFFDDRCPYCRQVEPPVQTLMKGDSGARLVQKEFPILGPASVYAARVALAAWKQGNHTAFHDALI